jgi:AcrR family transcriptional regulator
MEANMDRRQKKTRNAIFEAFIQLLGERDYTKITVGDIIDRADVGRATFYAHFETKEFLLKELCAELFEHVFLDQGSGLFHCDAPDSVFLHLFQHIGRNDSNILRLLRSRNNTLFLEYFQENLANALQGQLAIFDHRRDPRLPEGFWVDHICATFTQTLRWWVEQGMTQSTREITEYFMLAV